MLRLKGIHIFIYRYWTKLTFYRLVEIRYFHTFFYFRISVETKEKTLKYRKVTKGNTRGYREEEEIHTFYFKPGNSTIQYLFDKYDLPLILRLEDNRLWCILCKTTATKPEPIRLKAINHALFPWFLLFFRCWRTMVSPSLETSTLKNKKKLLIESRVLFTTGKRDLIDYTLFFFFWHDLLKNIRTKILIEKLCNMVWWLVRVYLEMGKKKSSYIKSTYTYM